MDDIRALGRGEGASAIAERGPAAGRPASLFQSTWIVLALAVFVGFALTWSNVVPVWTTNRFFDTDDAMHLVQVRDWLAGQGWFDMIEPRLDPPAGTLMHWSRIVDVPLAASIRLFALFADRDTAERLTRIVYPLALQACLYAAVLWTARKLVGFRGAAVATLLAACSLSTMVQFSPGRINHHNVQIVLLVLMLGCSLDALTAGKARLGAGAALAAALSLAISLEDLPFIGVMIAAYAIAWVARGEAVGRALAWFAGAFCLGLACAFLATVPPHLFGSKVCDALSVAHLLPGEFGGAALAALALGGSALRDWRLRAAACAGAGALTLALLAVFAPACLGNPYGAVDPLVATVWLSHVSEAQPLGALFMANPGRALPLALPLALGAVSTLWAIGSTQKEERGRWLLVAAFLWTGLLGAFWEVIVGTYIAALVGLGSGFAFERLIDAASRRGGLRMAAAGVLVVATTPQSWALAGLALAKPPPSSACFETSAFDVFAKLPPGALLGPIDAGPYILVFSDLSVVDGPYHRDNVGNRSAIEAWTSLPDVARRKVAETGAAYVAICPDADEMRLDAQLAPGGLAAVLAKGPAPDWLREITPRASVYRVFRVLPTPIAELRGSQP